MNKPSISKKISPEVKESALLVGTGIIYQQLGNYTQAQENIDAGVTKIRGIYMENQRDTGIFNIYELLGLILGDKVTEKNRRLSRNRILKLNGMQ